MEFIEFRLIKKIFKSFLSEYKGDWLADSSDDAKDDVSTVTAISSDQENSTNALQIESIRFNRTESK